MSLRGKKKLSPRLAEGRISKDCMCVCSVAELCLAFCDPHGLQPTRLLCPWDFPGKHIGVSCHFLLQGIFLTQGLNPHLLWQADSLPLSHLGSQ